MLINLTLENFIKNAKTNNNNINKTKQIHSIHQYTNAMTVESSNLITMDTMPDADTDSLNFRPMHCELNALTRADGSALFTQGTLLLHLCSQIKSTTCNK